MLFKMIHTDQKWRAINHSHCRKNPFGYRARSGQAGPRADEMAERLERS
jgi:hypothetical protein